MTILLLETFLPYRLSRAAAQVSREFREIYEADHKLTVPEWRVLATLGQFGTMTATAVGEHSSLHKTKVSRAVRSLELQRWLTRREAIDRRIEELTLTHRGRSVYAKIVPRAAEFEAALLKRMGTTKKKLLEALDRLDAESLPSSRRRPRRRLTT